MRFLIHASVLPIVLLGACTPSGAAPETRSVPVRVASSTVAPMSCQEAVQRAAAKPDLDVDRLPSPLKYEPRPIPRKVPRGVVGKNGYSEVRIQVLVDTLGRADMKTFRVVKSTSPWLTKHVKSAVGKWKFTPAELGGCKVPRVFKWAAVSGKSASRR